MTEASPDMATARERLIEALGRTIPAQRLVTDRDVVATRRRRPPCPPSRGQASTASIHPCSKAR